MNRLIGILNILTVILALGLWGLITDMLWDADYKLPAMAAFILMPVGFFYLAPWYDQWRRTLLSHQRRRL
jgi:ABC-type nitrate/sulfonate/bicarbonate transport system permease component